MILEFVAPDVLFWPPHRVIRPVHGNVCKKCKILLTFFTLRYYYFNVRPSDLQSIEGQWLSILVMALTTTFEDARSEICLMQDAIFKIIDTSCYKLDA